MPTKAVRSLPPINTLVPAVVLLLSATALAGCAQQVRVTSDWQDNAPRDQPFSTVLVVGVSPDYNQRCAFESFLTLQIRSESTTAIASCRVMSQQDPLTLENIERVIAEHQIDAVLATFLVAAEIRGQEGGTSETRGDAYYKATDIGYGYYGYFGAYGMPVIYGEFRTAPSIMTVQGQVEITTRLFNTADATLVYELNTKAQDLESRESGLAIITGPIAERLRRDGVIR
jgi:hypothetical protein